MDDGMEYPLVRYLSQQGLDFVLVCKTREGLPEYASDVCPLCGRNDHGTRIFTLTPSLAGGKGAWRCFSCSQGGNGVSLLHDQYGLSYRQAYATLELSMPQAGKITSKKGTPSNKSRDTQDKPQGATTGTGFFPLTSEFCSPTALKDETESLPCEVWRNAVMRILTEMDTCLPLGEYDRRCGYITHARGLDSVRNFSAYGVVFNPATQLYDSKTLGLIGSPVVLPEGLLLAVRRKQGIVCLLSKPLDVERYGKHRVVRGSMACPSVFGRAGLPLIICESHLDAALCFQEGKGKLAALATNSAAWSLSKQALAFAKTAPRCWFWADNDAAGEQAYKRLKWLLPDVELITNPNFTGKDVGELYRHWRDGKGCPSVAQWLCHAGALAA